MEDGARSSMCRSLAVKAVLLLAASATVLWLGWHGGPDPAVDPSPAPSARAAAAPPARIVDAGTASVAARPRIDVNLASMEELTAVEGIGTVLAERIISHRQAVGPYASFEELLDIRGIGPGRLAGLRSSLALSSDLSHPPPTSTRNPRPQRGPRS